MRYYVLIIDSGVEAGSRGPFATAVARDEDARNVVALSDFSRDYDSIFRMDIESDSPKLYPFADSELFTEVEA